MSLADIRAVAFIRSAAQRLSGSPKYATFLLTALLAVLYVSYGTYRDFPYKIESDGKYYYQFLISMTQDGDIDFSNNYRVPKKDWMILEIDHYKFREQVNPVTGLPRVWFPCGVAVLWAPFYLATDAAAALAGGLGLDLPRDPWSRFYQYSVMFSGVVYTALTIYLALVLLTRRFAPTVASLVVAVVLFGSNWAYYATVEVSLSHTYDLFTAIALLWAYVRILDNARLSSFVAFGLAGALHVLVRHQNAVTVAVLGLMLVGWQLWRWRGGHGRLRELAYLAIAGAIVFIGITPQLWVNAVSNGHPLKSGYPEGFLRPLESHPLSVLFSTRNGLFSHHPILLAGLAGALVSLGDRKLGNDRSWVVSPLLAIFLIQTWLNGAAPDWWGGHSFGQRRLVGSYFILMFGLAYVASRLATRWPRAFARYAPWLAMVVIASGLYLMHLHVHYWSYEEPHNILEWIFILGPKAMFGL